VANAVKPTATASSGVEESGRTGDGVDEQAFHLLCASEEHFTLVGVGLDVPASSTTSSKATTSTSRKPSRSEALLANRSELGADLMEVIKRARADEFAN
jgi:hypothetical protein